MSSGPSASGNEPLGRNVVIIINLWDTGCFRGHGGKAGAPPREGAVKPVQGYTGFGHYRMRNTKSHVLFHSGTTLQLPTRKLIPKHFIVVLATGHIEEQQGCALSLDMYRCSLDSTVFAVVHPMTSETRGIILKRITCPVSSPHSYPSREEDLSLLPHVICSPWCYMRRA